MGVGRRLLVVKTLSVGMVPLLHVLLELPVVHVLAPRLLLRRELLLPKLGRAMLLVRRGLRRLHVVLGLLGVFGLDLHDSSPVVLRLCQGFFRRPRVPHALDSPRVQAPAPR